ncbi:uncharacterized protein [Atheta coriaria]|uniref:uncharacterized protein n=1 Tax=Dalotia coriaria TaxID=877792 RepID=UPI0031F3C21A
MENIYKIKIRTNPDPTGLYPSERRYSASTVLGLSVVHIALAITALLMAMLSISNYHIHHGSHNTTLSTIQNEESTSFNTSMELEQAEVDLTMNATREIQFLSLTHRNCALAPCLMSLGAFLAGIFGLLAWKRWYIDHNIRWFFLATLTSTILSSICVFVMIITLIAEYEKYSDLPNFEFDFRVNNSNTNKLSDDSKLPNIKFVLSLNIMIACLLEMIWSGLSARVAFAGMRNSYPDDIIISKSRGKIEVNTVHKGNKKAPPPVVPPDILNHFPNSSKLAKYLPKTEDGGNLPKTESNSEYQERVRKFLSGSNENKSEKCVEHNVD